jgi:hypothetical protein
VRANRRREPSQRLRSRRHLPPGRWPAATAVPQQPDAAPAGRYLRCGPGPDLNESLNRYRRDASERFITYTRSIWCILGELSTTA